MLTRRFHDGTGVTELYRETRTEAFPNESEHRWRLGAGVLPVKSGDRELLLFGIGNGTTANETDYAKLFGLPR